MKYILKMIFESTGDSKKTIIIPNAKEGLLESDVTNFADVLISENIITDAKGNDISKLLSAIIIKTEETELIL